MLHSLRAHAAPLQFFQKHLIIVDPLAARGDLHPPVQTVKAQGIPGIRGIVHGVKGTFFPGIVGDEYEVGAVFLLKIPADQRFLLRLQIIGAADGAAVFFTGKPLCLVKPHAGDAAHIRKRDPEQGKLPVIIPLQDLHDPSQHAGLHCHHILKAVDISHFKVQRGILVQMPFGVVLFRPENRGRFKHPVKHAHHHLLVKLRALRQHGGPVKIVQPENVRAALRSPGSDLGRMDLGKALFSQILPKAPHHSLLDPEAGPLSDISEGNGPQIQTGFQGNVHLRLRDGNRQRRGGAGQDGYPR